MVKGLGGAKLLTSWRLENRTPLRDTPFKSEPPVTHVHLGTLFMIFSYENLPVSRGLQDPVISLGVFNPVKLIVKINWHRFLFQLLYLLL